MAQFFKLYSILFLLFISPVIAIDETSAIREFFYAGGSYVNTSTGYIFTGQMYVEKLSPVIIKQPYPLVFIHGLGQTGTNWLNKPDGTIGWASWFLEKGYEIYIIDQPFRGRSPWNPASNQTLSTLSAEFIEHYFTAPEKFNLWPQASLHTQWPGSGLMGSNAFDTFYAGQVQYLGDVVSQQTAARDAGAALLDQIGPAILITHSQGGILGWLWADARPDLVKAIVAIEPTSPPFRDVGLPNPPGRARAWGVTDIPLSYNPAPDINEQTGYPLFQTKYVNQVDNLNGSAVPCILQVEPAMQLENLYMPVLIETGQASFHAPVDHCTVLFLQQAGVNVTELRLGDKGIQGNGHMQFLEKNSDDIAECLETWISKAF